MIQVIAIYSAFASGWLVMPDAVESATAFHVRIFHGPTEYVVVNGVAYPKG